MEAGSDVCSLIISFTVRLARSALQSFSHKDKGVGVDKHVMLISR